MPWINCCLIFALFAVPTAAGFADEKQPELAEKSAGKLDREALEQQFAEKLSGAALVGSFTVVGKDDGAPLKPERYEIAKVSKLRDDYWVFNARLRYRQVDITLPITLKVFWAGDTPVISLTDMTIPGRGSDTFTARVLFYGDRYVGTWQHGKAGGHMFVTIEKLKSPKTDEAKKN